MEEGLVGVVGHRRLPSICSVDAVPHGGFGLVERVERMVDLPTAGAAEGPVSVIAGDEGIGRRQVAEGTPLGGRG